jgi:ribose transport system substrate-binding protein
MSVKNKKKKETRNHLFAVTTFWLLVLMVLVTLVGIVIFKMQIDAVDLPEDEKSYTEYNKYFAMITDNDKADFWQDVYAGAKQSGEEQGNYVELFASDMGQDYSVEERMEIAIAANVDGIIVEGNDVVTLRRKIEKAKENGIPVVVVNQDLTDSERISFVGLGRYDLGQTYGRQTCELAETLLENREKNAESGEEPLQVMVLTGQEPDSNGQNLLISGIREEIAKNEELANQIVLETYPINDSGSFAAEEAIRDIFVGNEDVPDILICLNEIHTSCAYQALIDYNRVGITNLIGYYDSETILNGVSKEIIYSTISIDAKQMGRYSVDALSEYLETGYVSEYFTVDTYVINRDNVAEYLEGE